MHDRLKIKKQLLEHEKISYASDVIELPKGGIVTVDFSFRQKVPTEWADMGYEVGFVQFVYENDLMIGMSDTEFGENLPLTRGMIVTVLHRMEGRPEVTYTGVFTDVTENSSPSRVSVTGADRMFSPFAQIESQNTPFVP